MRRFVLACLFLLAPAARAESLDPPYWSIQYDLTGSTVQVRDTLAGLYDGTFPLWGKGTNPNPGEGEVGVSPGTMTLELPDCGGIVCSGAGSFPARLVQLELEQHFKILPSPFAPSIYVDTVAGLLGDASGLYDGASTIAWSPTAHADWNNLGNVVCVNGSNVSCSLLQAGLQPGDNPVNEFAEEAIGPFVFQTNPTNPSNVSADWRTATPPFGRYTDFGRVDYHLRATEIARTFVPAPTPVPLGSIALFATATVGFGIAMIARSERTRPGSPH